MNKSEAIRDLGRSGMAVADIGRRVGVRYQFAHNVLERAGLLRDQRANVVGGNGARTETDVAAPRSKPTLCAATLKDAGFERVCQWKLASDGQLRLESPTAKTPGVYAFVKGGDVLYVGVATVGLGQRLYFYGRPGPKQLTNIRINALLKDEIAKGAVIEVYTGAPTDFAWNGLPVRGAPGLELGLIETYRLPWNKRGVRP